MINADIHVHTSFSADSETDMEKQVRQAVKIGLKVLCFTDHIDWDYPECPDENLNFDFDPKAYFARIAELKEKYRDQIKLLAGVELGMQEHLAGPYKKLIEECPFDYVIGSQHLVMNMDPYYPQTFEGRTDAEVYRAYFEEMLNDIRAFHEFDSLGHLDYIVRYGRNRTRDYSYRAFADIIDEILKLLIRRNLALEINTAGLRKHLGQPNPHRDILRRYRELGGTLVTAGSDAHKPEHLGYGLDRAGEILKGCGFTHYVYYEKRSPKFVRL